MKFNCGPSPETKRRREREAADEARLYYTNWHPFFAILPRRVGENDCRCFERIERKGTVRWACLPMGMYPAYRWEYRAKQETK